MRGPGEAQGDLVLAGAAHRATVCRILGVTAGALAAGWLATVTDGLGLGLALAPAAFAVCVLTGVLIGELIAVPVGGVARSALLEVRAARNYLPRGRVRWVLGLAATLFALLAGTSLAGSADDLGRAGRALSVACANGSTQSASPWPGTYYALPVAAVVLIGGGLAVFVGRVLRDRSRPGIEDRTRAADEVLRARSMLAITGACGVLVAAPLAGTALFTGMALLRLCSANSLLPVLGWVALAIAGVAVVAGLRFAADLVPGR
ncbi:hypothetical protein [Crossiella cryophila]|uniref:Uncharacterized protein n=1 Tax=Crossiella cryophila TaxID=43355 RepID=A0A7W7CEZ7_9PSEU|nr:hypothetical protein [Crossiella cryophila]MBB4679934.1 hypothetical protein [Crossiella cryophila]